MRGYEHNPFAKFLHSIFDADAGADVVQANIERYAVGTSSRYNGSAIFWQIDQFGRMRSGQIIGYDPTTGTQNHKQQNWVHSVMQENYPEDARFDVSYFARDEQTLAANAVEALAQETRLVYSIAGEELWELSGDADPQSILGLGDLAIQRADGTQRVPILFME